MGNASLTIILILVGMGVAGVPALALIFKWRRRRKYQQRSTTQRSTTQRSFVMPLQPMNPQPQMSIPFNPYPVNPKPAFQPFPPTPIISNPSFPPSPPVPSNSLYSYPVNHMPVFPPIPLIPNASSSTSLPPPASNMIMMDRMRQVQKLMVEINHLERESGEGNAQRVQELNRLVVELTDTNGHQAVPNATPDSQQPPPYFPRDNDSGERPELGDGSG